MVATPVSRSDGPAAGHVTRAVVFTLDPSPAQERLLRSYCGAARVAFNWARQVVVVNLDVRRAERDAGVAEDALTPAVSWSAYSLRKQFNQVKDDVAPWHREVAKHAFDTGITNAATALKNWSDSKKGTRRGRPVGFPHRRTRKNATLSVSFVELNHQLSWLHPSRHAVRLMLPQALRQSSDRHVRAKVAHLEWLHTVESTRRLYRLVEQGRATIQKVTIAHRGGRWQVSFLVRHQMLRDVRKPKPGPHHGAIVGVDVGVRHLATLSEPVWGLTDEAGHVANPRVLHQQLRRLRKLDRAIARCTKDGHGRWSRNRRRLVERRARLHGRIAKTRQLHLHALTNALADGFDTVVVEDLNLAGMTHRKRRLGRHLADASLAELVRQLDYKIADRTTPDRDKTLVTVNRYYPSSKTCSRCGTVTAKLPLAVRVFDCTTCGMSLDRDINAARNLARAGLRLLGTAQQQNQQPDQQPDQHDVAGLRPETRNADPRPDKTPAAHAAEALVA